VTARRATALLCAVAALLAPSAARADGDPASDVLLFQDVYLPYFPAPSQAEAETLERLLREVKSKGYPMKVAVIGSAGDLGAYPDLFGKPDDYAKLLAGEIAFRVKNPHLLILMADGGFAGRNLGDGLAATDDIGIEPAEQTDGLVRAAIKAVAAIASANGHATDVPEIRADEQPGTKDGGSHVWMYVLSGVIVLLGLALIVASFVSRRGRRAPA
jgi:hypothetical protein